TWLGLGFGNTLRPNVVRNVVRVAVDKTLAVIGAANNSSAQIRATVAYKVIHLFVIERGVVHRDLFAGTDSSTRHHVQTFKPGIRITGMIDWFPVLGIRTP